VKNSPAFMLTGEYAKYSISLYEALYSMFRILSPQV
jgi:hypothetical protein